MKRTKLLIAVFVLFLAASTALWAQPVQKASKDKRGNFAGLNLTDQQEDQMEKLRFANQEKMIAIRAEIAKNKLEMKKLLVLDGFSKSDLMNLVKKENELEANAKLSRTEMWADVYQILNAEQKETWVKQFTHRLKMNPRHEMRERVQRKHRMMDRAERRER